MSVRPDWIAVDWGTSNLRAWAMAADGAVLAEAGSPRGMGSLDRDGFEPALLDLIAPWTGDGPVPVVACGMVGARQGWVEARYGAVPGAALPEGLTPAPARTPGLAVGIVPGLAQQDPPDVMRGEETQVAGLLALRPGWEGTVCLPGTHTKWVAVSAGEVTGFRTFMTGEIFAALTGHTVLRLTANEGWDDDAFLAGVGEGMASPEALANRLFSLRAEALLTGLPAGAARARASGLLIGMELRAARGWWLGMPVAVVGAGAPAAAYRAALAAQGVEAEVVDVAEATLAGLREARRRTA